MGVRVAVRVDTRVAVKVGRTISVDPVPSLGIAVRVGDGVADTRSDVFVGVDSFLVDKLRVAVRVGTKAYMVPTGTDVAVSSSSLDEFLPLDELPALEERVGVLTADVVPRGVAVGGTRLALSSKVKSRGSTVVAIGEGAGASISVRLLTELPVSVVSGCDSSGCASPGAEGTGVAAITGVGDAAKSSLSVTADSTTGSVTADSDVGVPSTFSDRADVVGVRVYSSDGPPDESVLGESTISGPPVGSKRWKTTVPHQRNRAITAIDAPAKAKEGAKRKRSTSQPPIVAAQPASSCPPESCDASCRTYDCKGRVVFTVVGENSASSPSAVY